MRREMSENTLLLSGSTTSARFLYASYFFAAWGDRMWEFAAIIFLMDLFPDTLLPSSLLGFAETAAGIVGSTAIGAYIDRTNRLTVVRLSVAAQNVSIAVAGAIFYVALSYVDSWSRRVKWMAFAALCICACVARWASSMNKIALHKNWLVVLAHDNSELQTKLNANMRRVDLICSIVAPLAVGVLSSLSTNAMACVMISAWSTASFFVEWFLNGLVYARVPALHVQRQSILDAVESAIPSGLASNRDRAIDDRPLQESLSPQQQQLRSPLLDAQPHHSTASSIGVYVRHPVFLASLAYCLLYVSCLSFGGIMVAYLKTLGLSDALLAGGRAIAALVGVFATVIAPIMIQNIGLLRSGVIAVWLQFLCLAPLVVVGFILLNEHSRAFMILVFFTICSSRFGLWLFDLIETQLMQELIVPADAGRINGAQEALMNVGYLMSFVLTMVFSNPAQFVYPAIVSVSAVASCAICFSIFVRRHGS